MRIGIVTGGGDVPGLNPCIKTLVNRMSDGAHAPTGIRRGWRGLLQLNPDDPTSHYENSFPLNRHIVRSIDRSGGTILHTSRANPGAVPYDEAPDFLRTSAHHPGDVIDFTPHILRALDYLKLDALVVLGGDDTLAYAARLAREGFPILAIPKTMDNDVTGTEYCLGFSTAITRSVAAIQEMRTTVASHERIGVIEVFGRYSGDLSLMAAYLSGSNRAIISEVPFDVQRLGRLLSHDRATDPSQYAMMTISEGARAIGQSDGAGASFNDPVSHQGLAGIGMQTARQLEQVTGVPTVFVQLSFLVRAGPADTLDTMVAMNFATAVMDLVDAGQFGRMVAVCGGRYQDVPLDEAAAGPRMLDVASFYDEQEYRPHPTGMIGKPVFWG